MFRDNRIDGYGLSRVMTSWAIAFCTDYGTVSDLTFTRNTIERAMPENSPAVRTNAGLTVWGHKAARKSNIVITDNVSPVPATRGAGDYAMYLANIDGLTVTGNVQVMTVGQLTNVSNCTGVTVQR